MSLTKQLEVLKHSTKKPFLCYLGLHRWWLSPNFDVVETSEAKELWVVWYCRSCFKYERVGMASHEKKKVENE